MRGASLRLLLLVGSALACGLVAGAARAAQPGPRLLGFALPGRGSDALTPRVARIADELAGALGGTVLPQDDPGRKPLELLAPIERARGLARRALFDQAAQAFDEVLGAALRAPQRVDAPAQLVAAMVARISIAIARHEPQRAAELLDRLLRYEPALALPAAEDEPGVHAQLQAARRRLGPRPTLGADELGAACRVADVLVVARSLEGGQLELSRFDDCKLVAHVELAEGGDEHAAAAALAPGGAPNPIAAPTAPNPIAAAPASRPPRHGHALRVAGWTLIGVGAGALVAGATLAGLAKAANDDIEGPAPGASWSPSLQQRLRLYEELDATFLAVGGAALVAGVVVEVIGWRAARADRVALRPLGARVAF